MPLADRNLFVALKQERWAGCSVQAGPLVWRNKEEVCHVFKQLVHCVEHMHGKGVLHLNTVARKLSRLAARIKAIAA
jgi:ribosomal protein S20